MGIVKISNYLHVQLRLATAAMDRSINAQAELWIKVEPQPALPRVDRVRSYIPPTKR
ncbi:MULTISPECIES: hypothetical protein [unclassified Pseudomonas]|uniref:TA system antitoxin ParD family protein n=1 Tax=unclassified Pseudomonas TaxID=196821 RepID=UPI000B88AE87|nr:MULTISPECIES: hypothetical protein [unclassified Pseudomonas]